MSQWNYENEFNGCLATGTRALIPYRQQMIIISMSLNCVCRSFGKPILWIMKINWNVLDRRGRQKKISWKFAICSNAVFLAKRKPKSSENILLTCKFLNWCVLQRRRMKRFNRNQNENVGLRPIVEPSSVPWHKLKTVTPFPHFKLRLARY